MSPCLQCEVLPEPLLNTGVLYLSFPLAETRARLTALLTAQGIAFSEPFAGGLALTLPDGALRRLGPEWGRLLSSVELADSRALLVPDGHTLALADLRDVESLHTMLARAAGDWLLEVLAEDRLLTHFQPIVRTNVPSEVFAYECLLRGRASDGDLIPPIRLFDVARSAGLLFHLDRAARLTAIRGVIAHAVQSCVFINFNPISIYTPTACLRSLMAAINDSYLRPQQLVFEVVESDEITNPAHLLRILDFYRQAGFRVALDDVGAGYSSLVLLSQLRPDFIKLDVDLIRGVADDPYKSRIAAMLLDLARSLGVQTIVEGVETVGEWEWARRHGADYVQGYLFARPASPPPLPRLLG